MRFRLCLDCRHKNTLKNPENGCFLTKTTVFSWSEWGDSNSRHLEPKSSALPTGPHPDIYFFFLRKVVKHVVKFHFLPPKADYQWKFSLAPQRLFCFPGKLSTSRAPAPKPGALPTGPHPDTHYSLNAPGTILYHQSQIVNENFQGYPLRLLSPKEPNRVL